MRYTAGLLMSVAIAFLAAPALAGEVVSHPALGLSFNVPDGFVKDDERAKGEIIFAFQRPPKDDEAAGTFLLITRLGGAIGREKVAPIVHKKRPEISFEDFRWQQFDLETARNPEVSNGVKFVTFNTNVPLTPEAIQVSTIGLAAKEEESRTFQRSVVASVQGRTNWLNSEQRIAKLTEGIARLAITVAVVGGVVIFAWRAIRRRRTPAA